MLLSAVFLHGKLLFNIYNCITFPVINQERTPTKSKNLLLPYQSTEKETSAIAIGKTGYRPMIIRTAYKSFDLTANNQFAEQNKIFQS